jgi:hypothetical protein
MIRLELLASPHPSGVDLVQFGANKATVRNGLAPNCLSVSRRSYLPVYLSRETLVTSRGGGRAEDADEDTGLGLCHRHEVQPTGLPIRWKDGLAPA